MKIYTKTGDQGETSLFGGKRVKKSNPRLHAYGTSDELNAWIGLIRDQAIDPRCKEVLLEIQDRLFTLGAQLAADPDKPKLKMPNIETSDITLLENEIDEMEKFLPPLTHFTLPGGHSIVSHCHITRCVCRRCERLVIELADHVTIAPGIVQYLNRLSDYLFVLGRKLGHDLNAEEKYWYPRK